MTTELRVSVEGVAKHLGVARNSVYRWTDVRNLPAHKIGREIECARPEWLEVAEEETRQEVEGERLAPVQVQSYFAGGGIETEEQLDAALSGLREECARLIGAGKKVVVS